MHPLARNERPLAHVLLRHAALRANDAWSTNKKTRSAVFTLLLRNIQGTVPSSRLYTAAKTNKAGADLIYDTS